MASRIGFLVLVLGVIGFNYRLIIREEAGILASQGGVYDAYRAAVPRLLPALRPRVPSGNATPNRPHPSHSQARSDFPALPVIRSASAVRERLGRPRVGPSFRCLLLLDMSPSATPGDRRLHVPSSFTADAGLRPLTTGSALPRIPPIRFPWGYHFGAVLRFTFAATCRFAGPPSGSDRAFAQPLRTFTSGLPANSNLQPPNPPATRSSISIGNVGRAQNTPPITSDSSHQSTLGVK